jgi:predicted transcriptional regulator
MDKLMSYTTRADIMATVLKSMSSGNVTLTKVYLAFLTKEYVAFLEKKDLIRFDARSKTYAMTEEGVKVLGKLEDLGTLLDLEHPMSSEIPASYLAAEPMVRSRSRGAGRRELDSRPMIFA